MCNILVYVCGILQLTLSSFVTKTFVSFSTDNPHPSHDVTTVNHVQWEGPGDSGEGGMGGEECSD